MDAGDGPEAWYSNYFRVGFNAVEFLIEIGQAYQEEAPGPPHTRVVMAPMYAKEFARLLSDQVARYELQHGMIATRGDEAN